MLVRSPSTVSRRLFPCGLVLLGFLCFAAVQARATALPATISTNTTLTAAKSPYDGNGTTTVKSGVTLKIEPGVKIEEGQFVAKGVVTAEGTAVNPIVVSGGFHTAFDFESTSSASVLNHVDFLEANRGVGHSAELIEIYKSSPKVINSVFRSCGGLVIDISNGGSPEIAGNQFYGSGGAAVRYTATGSETGQIYINSNLIEGDDGDPFPGAGISVSVTGTPVTTKSIGANRIKGRRSENAPLSYEGPDIPTDLTSNVVLENQNNFIEVDGAVSKTATWNAVGVPIVLGEVEIASGATLTMNPGVSIQPHYLTVKGVLKAGGTSKEPIVFTSELREVPGEWNQIALENKSSPSSFNYVEVAYGGYTGEGALDLESGVKVTVTNSTFRGNSLGMDIRSPGSTVEYDRFRENGEDIKYTGAGSLSAPHNDWGCPFGPKECGGGINGEIAWEPIATLAELPHYCSGTEQEAANERCLLSKYEPVLVTDSEENYSPDSAAEATDNWGDADGLHLQGGEGSYTNVLLKKALKGKGLEEKEIAQSVPGSPVGTFQFTLSSLGATYPNSETAGPRDAIDERGSEFATFEEDAHRLEADGYQNFVYGKVVKSAGQTWLEYWIYYYYDDAEFAGEGDHEGDWESVSIGLDSTEHPSKVLLSVHKGYRLCLPSELYVEDGLHPYSYVGFQSHANYPTPGTYETEFPFRDDHADGAGFTFHPLVVPFIGAGPSWLGWPGQWGNSEISPPGPAFHAGLWSDPTEVAHEASACFTGLEEEPLMRPASAGDESIKPAVSPGDGVRVAYDVPEASGKAWPKLHLSLQEKADGNPLPLSATYEHLREHGEVVLPFKLQPGHEASVFGSLFYEDGRRVDLSSVNVQG